MYSITLPPSASEKKQFTGSKLIFNVIFFPSKLSLGKRFIGNFFQLTH